MKHFKLEEFTRSTTAVRLCIENNPAPEQIQNLNNLVSHVLDPLREVIKAPIIITSGFRSYELNKMIGGAPNSQHLSGCAADIKCCTRTETDTLWQILTRRTSRGQWYFVFDQAIYYRRSGSIHVSFTAHRANRQQVIVKTYN